MFCVTTAQLTKAVMGVDYESEPHASVKRRKTTDATQATPSKVTKITAADKASAMVNPHSQRMIPCHHPVTLIPCQKCLSSELFFLPTVGHKIFLQYYN